MSALQPVWRRPRLIPAPARPAASWQAELRCDDIALEELAEEWDELANRCRSATPFQAAGWLASWWRAYGRPGALRVVLVRRDGVLVGAAALARRRSGTLTGLGGGLVDYTDVLLDDEHAAEAATRLAAALPVRRPWHALELREVRPGSAAHLLYAAWAGRRHQLPDSLCQYLPAVPMEELLTRLPGRSAQRVRAKQRKAQQSGVEIDRVPPEETAAAVHELLRLHALQWEDRGVTREHLSDRFRVHLAESTTTLAHQGKAVLHCYRLDGEPVAVNLMLLGRSLAGLYLYGAHPRLRERLDIAVLLFGAAIEEARRAEIPLLGLMRGEEPYKERWRPDRERNLRLLFGPRRGAVRLTLRLAAVRTRSALAPHLRGPVRRLRVLLHR
jgi:hypothetical protein